MDIRFNPGSPPRAVIALAIVAAALAVSAGVIHERKAHPDRSTATGPAQRAGLLTPALAETRSTMLVDPSLPAAAEALREAPARDEEAPATF